MRLTSKSGFIAFMMDDGSDPKQEFSIPAGTYDVVRVLQRTGDRLQRPWLVCKEDVQSLTGLPEERLRKDADRCGLVLHETLEDRVDFLAAFLDQTNQWAACDVLGVPRPSFVRRQFEGFNIPDLITEKLDSVERRELIEKLGEDWEVPTIVDAILSKLSPQEQYRFIARLGLE